MARSEKSEVGRYSDTFWKRFVAQAEKRIPHGYFVGHFVGTGNLVHRKRLAINEHHDRSIRIIGERKVFKLWAHM